MFNYFNKKLKYYKLLSSNSEQNKNESSIQENICENINKNLEIFKSIFGLNTDITIREFSLGDCKSTKAFVVFLDGMVNKALINDDIIKVLMRDLRRYFDDDMFKIESINTIKTKVLSVSQVENTKSINDAVANCLTGDTLLIIDGFDEALIINTKEWETRGVEETKIESVVRGPRESFSEKLMTNTSLLRRKIKDPGFTIENMYVGKRTKTAICIAYIKEIVAPDLVPEIKRRINNIKTDAILESGYIEQFIEDYHFSIFSTIGNSEKPDVIAAKILEGRAAIIIDGTPIVLTVPMLLTESFQSTEDYYTRPFYASIIRTIRFISYFIATLGPSIYVVLTNFHQELIPTPLLFSMAASRSGVPFPTYLEAALMILTFEILREAGVRLPRPVGQSVSIVGALVIGEAAVSAGLIGAPMVIVVSFTAVASFVTPALTDSQSILRFIFLTLSTIFGGFGILIGLIGLIVYLASLESFGTPFFSPLAPLTTDSFKDTFIRLPLIYMKRRPEVIAKQDSFRQSDETKTTPSQVRGLENEQEN